MSIDNPIRTDVIIIGSGPGGIAAAITCVRAGMRVSIVTKRFQDDIDMLSPSESLHPGINSLLNELNITTIPPALIKGKYKGISVKDMYTPLGADEKGEWEGIHICRPSFNSLLLETAALHGANIVFDTIVDILQDQARVIGVKLRSGRSLYARFVIDGSGRKRIAGKKMNFKERFYSPPLVACTGLARYTGNNNIVNHQAKFIPTANSWVWLAPHFDDYFTWTSLTITHQQKPQMPALLNEFQQHDRIYSANMRWRIFRPLCTEGLILTGDAAAIIDPAAGQGILNALWSGIYAGKAVVSCMAQPSYENIYLASYDQWFLEQYEAKVLHLRSLYKQHGIQINAEVIDPVN